MAGRKFSDQPTGRRGFFRQLAIAAIDVVEQTGKEMADRSLAGFRRQTPYIPPPPPQDYYQHFSPQYMIYGPPWPPEYGPYVNCELRRKLQDMQDRVKRQTQGGQSVARDEGCD